MKNQEYKRVERTKRCERGRNVTLVIEFIRHPRKDTKTGNISSRGKREFAQKLRREHIPGAYDAYKFYLSPHRRSQQTEELMSLSGNGRKSLAFRRRLQLETPIGIA